MSQPIAPPASPTLRDVVRAWLEEAQQKLAAGALDAADLDALAQTLDRTGRPRQRLLYLHAESPSIKSSILAMALHEPIAGHNIELKLDKDWPYPSVQDALIDGWRVIHFPDQRAPFDDGEIDVLGYEFVLEKWEEVL
jgi:hypothetical protein